MEFHKNKEFERMFFIKKNYSVSRRANIDNNVIIGDYCVIEDDVTIESGSVLKNNVFIGSNTYIGKNNKIFSFATIGSISQDRKYSEEPTYLSIGNDNIIREYVSINRSTFINSKTKIGNNNLFLAYSHIGHDCVIEDNITLGCYTALGGHSVIMSNARICAHSIVVPFCRVANYSFLAANSKIILDMMPYILAEGNPAILRGLNIWALKKYKNNSINIIYKIYKVIINNKINMNEKIEQITKIDPFDDLGYLSFIKNSKYGVISNA